MRVVHAMLGLLVALATSVPAHAQHRRRPVVAVEGGGCAGRPVAPLDWVAMRTPTMARLGYGPICPARDVAGALAATPDELESCPSYLMLELANALFDQGDALERAFTIYRDLSRPPARTATPLARAIALYRAERTALRLGHTADALASFADLLGSGPLPLPLRSAAERYVVIDVLTEADLDADGTRDPDFPEGRLAATTLLDAPWAMQVALAAVRELDAQTRTEDATRARAAIRARWPAVPEDALAPTPLASVVVGGDVDAAAVGRAIPGDALRPCAEGIMVGAVLDVHMSVTTEGALTGVTVTPAGPTAACVQRVLESAHVPPARGEAAPLDGIVLIPEAG